MFTGTLRVKICEACGLRPTDFQKRHNVPFGKLGESSLDPYVSLDVDEKSLGKSGMVISWLGFFLCVSCCLTLWFCSYTLPQLDSQKSEYCYGPRSLDTGPTSIEVNYKFPHHTHQQYCAEARNVVTVIWKFLLEFSFGKVYGMNKASKVREKSISAKENVPSSFFFSHFCFVAISQQIFWSNSVHQCLQ